MRHWETGGARDPIWHNSALIVARCGTEGRCEFSSKEGPEFWDVRETWLSAGKCIVDEDLLLGGEVVMCGE